MKIVIDSIECECNDGDTILEVARRNDIQIPSICYLSNCSPTLACKMCMVEVDGKRTYSCNSKVKDGINVVSNTPEIEKDRNEIMTGYCLNHPLECGVCDKSGECELQDFTLMTKVDVLPYGVPDSDCTPYGFAQSFYDPALCIMCERCATTCKDNIGDNNLKAGKANNSAPDLIKSLMGKDPYSVFAKKQKGVIEFIGSSECKDCGECISACPVGAMSYRDFTYSSNAWELEKISSTCTHCGGGCELKYNVKHLDIAGEFDKIYRVQNDYLYNPICGAGRFAYDQVSVGKSSIDVDFMHELFNKATHINLGGSTSNEEIYVIDKIAKFYNLKVVNSEASRYKNFRNLLLSEFQGGTSSDILARVQDFKKPATFISLETFFKYMSPSIRYKINNNLKMQKGSKLISFASFSDKLLDKLGKSVVQIKTSNVLASLLGLIFANNLENDFNTYGELESLRNIKESIEVVESENGEKVESKTSVEFLDSSKVLEMLHMEKLDSLKVTNGGVILISLNTLDIFDNDASLAKVLATLCKKLKLKILYIPKESNIVGIANLINLDQAVECAGYILEKTEGEESVDLEKPIYSIGFREKGDFTFDVHLIDQNDIASVKNNKKLFSSMNNFFPIQAHLQSEGTITSHENRVMPFTSALPFIDRDNQSALDISDIAGILEIVDIGYMSDISANLVELNSIYKPIKSYELESSFTKTGEDHRGYFLEYSIPTIDNNELLDISNLQKDALSFNAILLDNQNQFNKSTQFSNNLQSKYGIYTSKELLTKLGFEDGEDVFLHKGDLSIESRIYLDEELADNIFLVSPLIDNIKNIFDHGFYSQIRITAKNPKTIITQIVESPVLEDSLS